MLNYTVVWPLTISSLINNIKKVMNLIFINPNITERKFRETDIDSMRRVVYEVAGSSEEERKEMKKRGYYPASLRHFLLWISENAKDIKETIFADQVFQGKFPCVHPVDVFRIKIDLEHMEEGAKILYLHSGKKYIDYFLDKSGLSNLNEEISIGGGKVSGKPNLDYYDSHL